MIYLRTVLVLLKQSYEISLSQRGREGTVMCHF